MFVINVVLTVKEEAKIDDVRELLRQHSRLTRTEPGCLLFNVCHAENDPKVFILNEHWESKEAWEVHKTAEGVTTIYQPQVIPLVERSPYFCEIVE